MRTSPSGTDMKTGERPPERRRRGRVTTCKQAGPCRRRLRYHLKRTRHPHTMDIRSLTRKIPDYPSPGITYYDLTTLLMDGAGFHALIDDLAARYAPRGIRKFVCMEWRGF